MKLLALDSSGLVASVAIVEDDNMLGEYTVNYKKTHSQTLLPMLDEVAKMTEQHRCHCSCSRTGLFYRTPYRFRYRKRSGTGSGQTVDPHSNCRCHSLQSVGTSVFDLSADGCETAADLHRYL